MNDKFATRDDKITSQRSESPTALQKLLATVKMLQPPIDQQIMYQILSVFGIAATNDGDLFPVEQLL